MALANPMHRVFALLVVLSTTVATLHAQNVNDGFDPNPDGAVTAIALQSNGKVLIGGNFTHVGGISRKLLARLNADGSLDTAFNPVIVGSNIDAIAVQSDGGIVIGGGLTQVGATSVLNLARLKSDGSVDSGFNPKANDAVDALVAQSDGRILVGGAFAQINGQPCQAVVRLNADGSTDSSFGPPNIGFGAIVSAMVQQADGRIVIGGYLHPGPSVSVGMMRLLRDGTADVAFQPTILNGGNAATVNALALQPDGRIVFSGQFSTVGAYSVQGLARIDTDGMPDALFNATNSPTLDNYALSIISAPSGDILLGGYFTHVNSATRNHVARLTRDGVLGTYNPNASGGDVFAMALQSDGDLLIGGLFSQIGSTTRHSIGRISLNGGYVDATLNLAAGPNSDSSVYALAAQPGGGLLVGGVFTTLGSTSRHYLARILADGSVDPGYNPSPDGEVNAIVQLGDGSAIVTGYFTHIGGSAQACVAHLNADGTVNTAFAPLFDTSNGCHIAGSTTEADGKILVFGGIFYINGAAHIYISRLDVGDGSVDASFAPFMAEDLTSTNNGILNAAPLPNGQMLIAGAFSSVAGHPIIDIARLNHDGGFDGTFAPVIAGQCTPSDPQSLQNAVASLVPQPDGKILIGGAFQQVDGQPAASIARLNNNGSLDAGFSRNLLSNPGASCAEVLSLLETADGKILAGGRFAIDYLHVNLARFNSNGTLDTTFPDLGITSGAVEALATARDGKIVLGGEFSQVSGITREHLARLSASEAAQQSLSVVGNTVTWLRSGSNPEATLSPLLYYSSDATTYVPLGLMTRIAGGWQYGGFSPPVGELYWLRTQAQTMSGQYDASQSIMLYTQELYLPDDIFKDGFGN